MRKLLFFFGLLCLSAVQTSAQTGATQDPSFAGIGQVEFQPIPSVNLSFIEDIDLTPDGSIYAAGSGFINDPNFDGGLAFITKFLANGQRDLNFGSAGGSFVWTSNSGGYTYATRMGLQNDGKIIVAQTGAMRDSLFVEVPNFQLCRLNTDGSVDETYGDNGFATLDISDVSFALAMFVQPDNKVVIAHATYDSELIITRLLTDGSIDPSFGDNGSVVLGEDPLLYLDLEQIQLARQPDGKFVLSCMAEVAHFMFRFLPNGQLDMTFGDEGRAILDETSDPDLYFGFLSRPLLHADGSIYSSALSVNDDDIGAPRTVKVSPTGEIDPSFDASIAGNFGLDLLAITSMHELPNGGILGVSATGDLSVETLFLCLVAFNSDGSIRDGFGANGVEIFPTDGFLSYESILTADKKLVVGGDSFEQESGFLSRIIIDGVTSAPSPAALPVGLALTPNPTTDMLRVQAGAPVRSWEVTNVLGQTMLSGMVPEGSPNWVIPVAQWPAGNYALRVIGTEGQVGIGKFVKK